jgi:hypothetical protein
MGEERPLWRMPPDQTLFKENLRVAFTIRGDWPGSRAVYALDS